MNIIEGEVVVLGKHFGQATVDEKNANMLGGRNDRVRYGWGKWGGENEDRKESETEKEPKNGQIREEKSLSLHLPLW